MGNKSGKNAGRELNAPPTPPPPPSGGKATPLETEREKEELKGNLMRLSNNSVVYAVKYELDGDGDFLLHFSTSAESKEYIICVQLKNSPNVSWKEARLIRESLQFSERFNTVTDENFTSFLAKMREKELVSTGGVNQQTIGVKEKVPVQVMNIRAADADIDQSQKAKVLNVRIAIDIMAFTVDFRTDAEEFSFVIKHKSLNGSYAMLEARAIADAVYIGEAGDKMDKSIFLQWVARLKAKFNIIGVMTARSGTGGLAAKLTATMIPCAITEHGVSVTSMPLPAVTEGAPDWSNETKARIGSAASAASADGDKPLAKERGDEERRANSCTDGVVTFLKYKLEAGKGLVITMQTGQEPKHYSIVIRLKDASALDWTDSRILAKVITFCERFTAFNKTSWKEFVGKMEEEGNLIDSVSYSSQGSIFVTEIKPKSGSIASQNPVGRVSKQGISVDSDNDWQVLVNVESTTYTVIVSHNETNNSVATLSAKALADVIYRTEPGDKLDNFMFLQHCARWRDKFHLVKVKKQNNGDFWVHMVPTALTEAQTGLTIESNIALPAVTESMDWAPETAARADGSDVNPDMKPLDRERATEERRASSNTDNVVCFLRYKLATDFIINVETGAEPKAYQIIIRLTNSDDLTWTASRVIAKIIAFCERFTAFTKTSLKEFITKITDEDSLVESVSYSNQGSTFVTDIKPKPGSIANQNPVGRVAKQSLSVDKDNDWQVVVIVEGVTYTVIVDHTEKNNSVGTYSAKALAEVIYRTEPGDKLDNFMFLQHCARWRDKFHLVKVKKQNNGDFWVHMVPTALTEAQTGLTIESNIALPAVTENMDWAPETAARAEGRSPAKVNAAGGDAMMAIVMDPNNALGKERQNEEGNYDRAVANSAEVITRILYRIDNGDFMIQLYTGKVKSGGFVLRVVVDDFKNMSWPEARCIKDCLKMAERFNNLTQTEFNDEWPQKLAAFDHVAKISKQGVQNGAITHRITPANGTKVTAWGHIRKQSLSFDMEHAQWKVDVETDREHFTFAVDHYMKDSERSFGMLQGRALTDVLYLTEGGDKFDTSIFLKVGTLLRRKFKLVAGVVINNIPTIQVIPIELADAASKIPFASPLDFLAMAEGEKLDWSSATVERLAAADAGYHSNMRCDGCNKSDNAFTGRRYHCVECVNYDLCSTCFDSQIETVKHRSGHAMQMFDCATCRGVGGTAQATLPAKGNHQDSPAVSDKQNDASPSPERHHDANHGSSEHPVFGDGRVVTRSLLKMSGQASVYRGVKNMKDGSSIDVAIKVYHNTTDWQDCKDELMVLLSLGRHDHVVQVLDFYEVPKPCFVMRMVDGGDLRDFLDKNGPIKPRGRAISVIKGICAGLKHLHDHDVVHRDLKSPNILIVQPDMRPVLIDLGLGKVTGDGATQMTVNVKGSFLWMAPEMLSETKWSYKTDIFALGVIMWEIFSGKVPYEAKNLAITGLLLHIMGGGRPDMALLASGLAQSADTQLMQQCWSADSANRPTIDQMLARL